MVAAVRPLPALLSASVAEDKEESQAKAARRALAALSVIGGFREVLRVGGKVTTFSVRHARLGRSMRLFLRGRH